MAEHHSPALPAHRRVADDLVRRIRNGEFPPGSKLPSNTALMRHYEVTIGVAQLAVGALRREGRVWSEQGRGVFVSPDAAPDAGGKPWREQADYERVADDLERRIRDGEFPAGTELPTQAHLMDHYGVSITVVRMAMQQLGHKQLIRSHQGKPAHVHTAPPPAAQPTDLATVRARLDAMAHQVSQLEQRVRGLEKLLRESR